VEGYDSLNYGNRFHYHVKLSQLFFTSDPISSISLMTFHQVKWYIVTLLS